MNEEKIFADAPLYLAAGAHLAQGRHSMHTPGHKGSGELFSWLRPERDLTELPDTDALFEASGAIFEAEKLASRYFGSARTAFSAGGCTLAIMAMIYCCCHEGDKIILDRCAHRSAVNCCALLGLEPVWLCPEAGENGIKGRISAEGVRLALEENPDAAAVYVTSPDYFGQLCELDAISRVCKSFAVPLLVDNAHGAHLRAFGKHPLQLGASFCACSAHKTLPVLTGGAFLSAADSACADALKPAMSLFGSTSPSYLIMQSLDLCRSWLENGGEEKLRDCAETVSVLKNEALAQGWEIPRGDCDPLRLTLLTQKRGVSGNALAEALRELSIEPEHSDDAAVILLCSPFDDTRTYELISRALSLKLSYSETVEPIIPALPTRILSPRAAALAKRETISADCAENRISAQAVCPCPPGIPLVMPGELITKSIAIQLKKLGFTHIEAVVD